MMLFLIRALAIGLATASLIGQELSIHRAVEIELETEAGVGYQLQTSADLLDWQDFDSPFRGSGRPVLKTLRTTVGALFVRAQKVENVSLTDQDVIFQHSTLDALLLGLYEGDLSFGDLLQRGDFGVGTFQGVDGELVVLDGQAYRIRVDGIASHVEDSTLTPFAVITFFEPDLTLELENVGNYDSLRQQLDAVLPSRNLLYAIRISSIFESLTTRSVPVQQRPYPPLVDVVANQTTFDFVEVSGTMVGFKLPAYLSGINASGYHFHYVDDARVTGGHVLELSGSRMKVEIDICDRLEIDLPEQEDFLSAELE
jgi:acetolactate decarboxylase